MEKNLRVISADSHVVEPADLWETRMDRKYRDRAPRIKTERKRAMGDLGARLH